jgi:hypothetical protein
MSSPRIHLSAFTLALGAVVAVLSVPSGAQQTLPYDIHAVFRTHAPHLKSPNGGGGGAGGGGNGGSGGGTVAFTGPQYLSIGATITPTSTLPEAEEHIAVDPILGSRLVAAISDFSLRGGSNTTKFAVSMDNGASWTESFVPLGAGDQLVTGDGRVWPYNSDPVVAIDLAGNVYLANLYFHSETGNSSNGLYVSAGADALPNLGITAATTFPVSVQADPGTSVSEDKEWIAVDNSASIYSGSVYVSWTRFVGNSDMIVFSRSGDHAATWSAPIQISLPSQNGAVQGSAVAVGPAGEVYVAYEVSFVGGKRQQFLAKSTDGGATFSTAASVTPLFNELSFNSTYRKNTFASMVVTPSGSVALVYAAQTGKNSSIEFIRSAAGGGSFSAPLALNDDSGGQRLMPSIASDQTGSLHVSWFDTRLAPRNSTAQYDIFATRSVNGGGAFSPNARVTSATIDAGSASFIGDYGGIAASAVTGSAHPVWTSGGFNNGRLQTAALGY